MSEPQIERVDSGTIEVAELAAQLRVDSIRAASGPSSGHVTSSLSAADLMAVLLTRYLHYDWNDPRNRNNDHLIFSKGHASPLLYSMFKAAGVIDDTELTSTYRRFGSRLQGHPTPQLPWVDVATGSLGQGLPIGVGIAWVARRLEKLPYHVWVLCGDSELAEGSIWEALDKAGLNGLSNLTVIVDVNRLGQRGPTELEWDLDAYGRRVEAFGARAIAIDGHDIDAIDSALDMARSSDAPTVILAKTVKGKGVPEIENEDGWHGKALPQEMAEHAVAALGGVRNDTISPLLPEDAETGTTSAEFRPVDVHVAMPSYELGEKVATRTAYGDALKAIGVHEDVVVTDGEVSNSTYASTFAAEYPERYFEMYIAEQQLIATAVAMSVRGYRPFASTFAAFFSRAYDFIRMAAVSEANIRLCGSHAGVEIGEDGPSQMALEDIAALRAIVGSTVLYPADATSAAALVGEMLERSGIVYLRTTRGKYPVLYPSGERFPIGGSKTLRSSDDDAVTLIGAGVTVHTCLAAAEQLATDGISARVIDLYSVKPLDRDTLIEASTATGGFVVVEDHHVEGGVGSAVVEALADQQNPPRAILLGVQGRPGSGTAIELMDAAGIGTARVVQAAHSLVDDSRSR
ncbi:transketolase [Leifsonia sp. Root112D2]|uniref:transketolase n=1 Tax=Leifsonia sp. Root112D2 TaxID=1736426 RepID=UPI0006FDB17D|nr:transketolase [Leifsonia sp. Root112D2]KQV04979.1 transketolase [Leifsonia sp. Root112D2]